MKLRHTTAVILGAAALGLGLVAPAAAQDGNRPDLDSPAGVEYQLPLERAREHAEGDDNASKRKSREGAPQAPPLFGEGIEPADPGVAPSGTPEAEGGGTGGSATDGGSGRRRTPPAKSRAGTADESERSRNSPLAAAIDDPGDGSGGGLIAAIAAAVLVGGAALGFALRRRPGSPSA